ncbi:MAG: hypothetical protein ACRDWY_10030 [Actinomycetes bacterium]
MPRAVFGAHGHAFTVEADDSLLTARAEAVLSTLRLGEHDPKGQYVLTRRDDGTTSLTYDGEEIGSRYTDDSLLLLLHWHVNQRVIDGAAARRTTFHAAAARSPRGHGILLPAPMESGKTTTVTGLLRTGWDFLTDEAAGVDPDGTVWAYPKPLTIDRGSWPLFPDLQPDSVAEKAESWLVPATRAGAGVAGQAPLRLIVFPQYDPTHDTALTRLRPSETALELSQSTFQFDRYGARDLRCVSALARSVPAYRLTIGDLTAAVDLIGRLDAGLAVAA